MSQFVNANGNTLLNLKFSLEEQYEGIGVHACGGKLPQGAQARLRERRPGLQHLGPPLVETGDRHPHLPFHGRQEVVLPQNHV